MTVKVKTPHNILVIRLSSIGDVVHTIPALNALRDHWPRARIDWAVECRCKDVLLDNPDVDALLEIDTARWRRSIFSHHTFSSLIQSVRQLRERRYDLVLDFQGTLKSAFWSFLARSNCRIGYVRKHLKEGPASIFYTRRIKLNTNNLHAIDRCLALTQSIGVPNGNYSFPLFIPNEIQQRANQYLDKMRFSSKYAVINPGGTWSTKRWSPERFGQLATAIAQEWQLPSLVLWGPHEKSFASRVVEASGGAAHLSPQTTVREMLPYIRDARIFVSGDTGPMHIASALNIPVVSIFGPTDPAKNGPFGGEAAVVLKTVPCGPCYKRVCPGYDNVCMTDIQVNDVLGAMRPLLNATIIP